MDVIVAKTAGFCFGVKTAVDRVEKELDSGELYTYGAIVHNKIVTDDLFKRGAKIIENTDISNSKVIFRAHGVRRDVHNKFLENNNNVIDCTCPCVKKIHKLVEENTRERGLIIIGDKNHPEVIGISGWSNSDDIIYITSEDKVQNLEFNSKEYVIVVQTTFNNDKLLQILDRLDSEISYKLFNTICKATSERQKEVGEIAQKVDYMIVLGDKKSSNSNKLYDISKKYCKKSYLLETIHDFDLNIYGKNVKIGITAGASTPNAIIKEAIKAMSDMESMSFEELLNESESTAVTSGKYVKGTISSVSSNGEVFVDLNNNQYTGIIVRGEFSSDNSITAEKDAVIGEEIEVYVMKVSDIDGIAELSKKRAEANKNFEVVEVAHNDGKTVKATITELVKGGAIAVVDGVRAFVPASQISHRFVKDLTSFVGKEFEFDIIELNRSKRKVVLSRKQLAAKEEAALLEEVYSKINVGDVVDGRVNRIVDFGAFVDINGVDGLIHISELSWSRVKKVSDILKVGDTVKVKIIDIDKEKNKVSVSLKDLTPNPWDVAETKYAVGTVVETKIARTTNFGAFVNLEDGIDALIHISQISNKHVEKVDNVLSIGQEVKAVVTEFDKDSKKISLSMKELEPKVEEVEDAE